MLPVNHHCIEFYSPLDSTYSGDSGTSPDVSVLFYWFIKAVERHDSDAGHSGIEPMGMMIVSFIHKL